MKQNNWRSTLVCLSVLLILSSAGVKAQSQAASISAEEAMSKTIGFGGNIASQEIRRAAVAQNGRIKPFGSLARETVIFLTGSQKKWGLDAVQIYLAIASNELAPFAPMIEVRDPDLRQKLGYTKDKRFFSLADLESSTLENLAAPLMQKQQQGDKLDEFERKIAEVYSQMMVFREVAMGDHLLSAMDFSFINHTRAQGEMQIGEIATPIRQYLGLLKEAKFAEADRQAVSLVVLSRSQKVPELFQHYLDKLDLELSYFDFRPFLWAAFLSLFSGFLFVFDITRKKFENNKGALLFALSAFPLILGLAVRVYITRFAPVTNMYGTMIWVALGVNLFSGILFALYRNGLMSGLMLVGSGLILLLTENIPLVLSPDMDPIVAVLRSNFWLSTHVTTITISYAAFTIAMILGNVVLVRFWFIKDDSKFHHEFFKFGYRMVQLGCFLLTVGIILGGVWADYSWGRFWGWDPKETWALIADLGFLVLLHARYIGWVNEFTFLAFSPVSYLLVVMAWYGVNFILAAGLHSYGFSSGGAMAVAIFVGIQLSLLVLTLIRYRRKRK